MRLKFRHRGLGWERKLMWYNVNSLKSGNWCISALLYKYVLYNCLSPLFSTNSKHRFRSKLGRQNRNTFFLLRFSLTLDLENIFYQINKNIFINTWKKSLRSVRAVLLDFKAGRKRLFNLARMYLDYRWKK